ncbi:DUF7133 domain-containing protein [Tautonia marina]|uniref:DUF7133 domain-containing protein n=1 Tax=Tautonia marina TaxID=2653855 RepID=UPI00126139D7|nr:c-type cytochrome [Tautonia marina]
MPPCKMLAILLICLGLVPLAKADEADEVAGLRIPPGFVVTEFSGSDLANDIQCMTIDPRGRVIVSGRGYTRILIDDDADGRADRALPFADGPKDGAMGLFWEDDSLYVVGDGGLRRYVDADDDGIADGPSQLILPIKTGGEHDAHAVRRGPDGWLYVMVGNFANVDESYASLPTSPIAKPVAGCLIRIAPDGKGTEIVADGFRNAYDFDFGPEGEIFTFDSDNERCVSLPWYEPTRFYHVVPGGHHGWLGPQQTDLWRLPPEMEDVVPPVAPIDRGSPTGVVCYDHTNFPAHYHNGIFFLDWTFGRVFFARPQPAGASFTAKPEIFLAPSGTEGFAWTDAEVHPHSGELYLSVGGRGTRGAVYRVRFVGDLPNRTGTVVADSAPRSETLPSGVLPEGIPHERLLNAAGSNDAQQRLRALVELKRRHPTVPADLVCSALRPNLDHPDRLLRNASAAIIAKLDPDSRSMLLQQSTTPQARLTIGFGLTLDAPETALALAAEVLGSPNCSASTALSATRLIQVALGGQPNPDLKASVWEGYSAPRDMTTAGPPATTRRLISALITLETPPVSPLDRERTRTLAMLACDDPEALSLVADRLTRTSDPVNDLHHLIVLGRLRAPRSDSVTEHVASALLDLDRKLDARHARRDRNWPLRVSELVEGLFDRDPKLADTMLHHPSFGRPDHALFARVEGFDLPAAAARFLDRADADPDFAWNAEVVAVLAAHPDDRARSTLRSLWGTHGLDDSIVPVLASDPIPEDRARFLSALRSSQTSTLTAALDGLDQLGPRDDPDELVTLIRTLRRIPEGPIRSKIAELLTRATHHPFHNDPTAWTSWFAKAYPDRSNALSGADGVDAAAWSRRFASIDWNAGNAEHGRSVFDRAQCSACHSGNRAVGPDLSGITGRFSRDDLLTAIVQPSRDIADRYRSLVVATENGSIFQGIVIYDAVDSLILQTGPTETISLDGDTIEERRPSDLSLMPAGLIDDLSDQEIADLDAYLRSLSS